MNESKDKIIALLMLFIIAVFIALLYVGWTSADAELLSDDIGISLSNSCIESLKSLLFSNCPRYWTISQVFPDGTLPQISGEFEVIDNLWQRNQKQLYKHYEYYRTDNKTAIWIDPPADVSTRIKTIEILPSLHEFKITNSTDMILHTDTFYRFMGHTRYVTPNCMHATISAENWMLVLGDTIRYMSDNCNSESTQISTVKKISTQKTEQDISTSRDYLHNQWIAKIKAECLTEYGKCK